MSSNLFKPIAVGDIQLQHRVVFAPLTRFRSTDDHVPNIPLMKEYYEQRACEPGTLLITEAVYVASQAGGKGNTPGIWNDEQIAAWKVITDAVHAKESYIYLQLFARGRGADEAVLKADGHPYISASDVQLIGMPNPPRPLTLDEIAEYVQLYATAAKNAVHGAGFDGVEIHGANGYLVDQFFQDVSNKRTDDYGGSIEKRSRFGLEVVAAVAKAVGPTKTAIRLSPWSTFQDMRMDDPVPQFTYIVNQLRERYSDLAYLHLAEPRIAGNADRDAASEESNDFLRDIWAPRPLISAGGFTRESAMSLADTHENELVAFGRYYISNPDIVKRLEKGIKLTPYNRDTFYLNGNIAEGYTDYPFAQ